MRIRTKLGLALVFTVCAYSISAQENFNSVRAPQTPAFTVLGVQPTAVERPNTLSDFSVAASNAITSFDSLPKGFTLEWAPYWVIGGNSVRLLSDTTRKVWQSLARTVSVSFASDKVKVQEKEIAGLSWGLRTMLFSGYIPEENLQALAEREAILREFNLIMINKSFNKDSLLAQKRTERLAACNNDSVCNERVLEWHRVQLGLLAKANAGTLAKDTTAMNKVKNDIAMRREGFMLELAIGSAYYSPNHTWEKLKFNNLGIWITPSYTEGNWSAIGVTRYLMNADSSDSFEGGIRGMYSNKRYSISAEFLKGYFIEASVKDLSSRLRIAVIGELRIRDNLWLQATLGADDTDLKAGSEIISNIGLSYGFSGQRY